MKNIYQHGEVLLVGVDGLPKKLVSNKFKEYILAHSETGHHHVLESRSEFEILTANGNIGEDVDELWVRVFEPTKLVHKKTQDKHRTLEIDPGTYKLFKKTEYDPFERVIRDVKD